MAINNHYIYSCRSVSSFIIVVGHVLQAHVEEPLPHVIHIETRSRPDTSPEYALSSRASDFFATESNSCLRTTTTPSSSPIIRSLGLITWSPQTTGTLTSPRVALTVPRADASTEDGDIHLPRSAKSRTPESITSPAILLACIRVASRSPKYPQSDRELTATTITSPGSHCSIAT